MSTEIELETEEQQVRRNRLIDSIQLAREVERRYRRDLHLKSQKALAEDLYPPDQPAFRPFWDRFSEPAEWLMDLNVAWKSRAMIEVLPGFEVIIAGKGEVITKPTVYDLTDFTTLHIRQSRETLKTGIARIDLIHDLIWWPEVRGVPAASVWWGFKLERAHECMDAVIGALHRLHPVWPEKFPENPQKNNFATKSPIAKFSTLDRDAGIPEPSVVFLAIKTKYTGGRWKSGHGDDLVNEEDMISATVREERKRDINAREYERDKIYGIRKIQGTDWHSEDAHQMLEKREGVFTVKMPCILGDRKKLFEFFDLPKTLRKKEVGKYKELCKPAFPHLDLETLYVNWTQTERSLWCAQMLLDARAGGSYVFNVEGFTLADPSDVQDSWAKMIFFDPAIKKAENVLSGDYMALGVVAWDAHGRRWLIDGAYRNDWQETDLFQEFGRLIQLHRPVALWGSKREAAALNTHWQQFALRNHLPITYINELDAADTANKMARIKGLEPDLRSGRIVLVRDIPITEAVLDEARNYDTKTGGAKNDDALDMLAQSHDPAVGRPTSEPTDLEGRWWEDDGGDDEVWLP